MDSETGIVRNDFDMISRENLRAELIFLKELFMEKLPIGNKTDDIKKYFSYLEQAIDNKDIDPNEIEREQFPPDDPATSGERVYRYHSASQFKKLAGGYPQFTSGQNMGHSESKQEVLSTDENKCPDVQDVAHVQEHTDN